MIIDKKLTSYYNKELMVSEATASMVTEVIKLI